MLFHHSPQIWTDFPELAVGVLVIDGVTPDAEVSDQVAAYQSIADERLASGTESDLPEIQAWRRTFTKMGLKPTQYRCASEALLRRYRKEHSLPQIHPLIVSEAMHESAAVDVVRLVTALAAEVEKAGWKTVTPPSSVSPDAPRFEF